MSGRQPSGARSLRSDVDNPASPDYVDNSEPEATFTFWNGCKLHAKIDFVDCMVSFFSEDKHGGQRSADSIEDAFFSEVHGVIHLADAWEMIADLTKEVAEWVAGTELARHEAGSEVGE